MPSQLTEFGARVKRLRSNLSLSQKGLARELGVSFATVNRWENGKTQPSKLAKRQFEWFVETQLQQGMLQHE